MELWLPLAWPSWTWHCCMVCRGKCTCHRQVIMMANHHLLQQVRACGGTNDFALCMSTEYYFIPGIYYSKAEQHCALLVIMQPPAPHYLLPSAKALLLVFAMLFVTLLGFFMTLQRWGRNEHLFCTLASLWLHVWIRAQMIPSVLSAKPKRKS